MAAVVANARARRWWRRLRAGDSGAELIEFALVFPTLLIVMLGIIDFGFLFQRYEVVTNAAREGARIGVLPEYADDAGNVEARVNQYLAAGGLTGTSTTTFGALKTLPLGNGKCVSVRPVTVTYDHQFIFLGPILGLMGGTGLTNKTLHATSEMRSEMPAASC